MPGVLTRFSASYAGERRSVVTDPSLRTRANARSLVDNIPFGVQRELAFEPADSADPVYGPNRSEFSAM